MYTFVTQLIGFFGLCCNVISYQQKKKTALILCQLFGGLLFAVHFLMLGSYIGAMMNVIAFIRAIVFSRNIGSERLKHIWAGGLVALCFVCYVLNFTLFKMEWGLANGIIQALPILAMFFAITSFTMKDAGRIRIFSLFASPLWLVYNVIVHSLGGAICEILSLVSILLGIIRHDIKRKPLSK